MRPAELLWRLEQQRHKLVERAACWTGSYDWQPAKWQRRLCQNVDRAPAPAMLSAWWLRHLRNREEPPFLLDHQSLAAAATRYDQLFAKRRPTLIANAERISRGEFSFLGITFQSAPKIDWHRDPVTGRRWPCKFYADLQIPFCDGTGSHGAPGDVKHVWELNRHEFLIECGEAYFLTKESRFARHVFRVITDWIAANPYLHGINWAGPLEVALRSMAWLWAYQFCRGWNEIDADDHLQLMKSFYLHGTYLDRHLEVYSSPNNHLVGEATALYLLGSFFPEFDTTDRWRQRAWGILESEVERQFYDDGGSTEQAISYHHYCLGFYVLAVLTRMRQQLPVPPAMLARLEAAFRFSMWLTSPDGTVPSIGDTDDARSIRFGPIRPWDFRNLLSIGAVIFQSGEMKAVAGSFSEDALWLLGPEGQQVFAALPAEGPARTSRVFPTSGYAVLRSDWEEDGQFLCFDGGSVGRDVRTDDVAIFTHGHADLLSFVVGAFGKPLLVDAGFYTYNGSPSWHRYTRDVQGHNTIRLNGKSQARFHNRNAWSEAAQPGPLRHQSNGSYQDVEGSHSGFTDVEDCTCHRRVVAWNGQSCWLVLDRLEGTGKHLVEAFFHFAPGKFQMLSQGTGVAVSTDLGVQAVLQCAAPGEWQLDAQSGEAEPDGGWIATSYGCKQPAPVVRFHGHVNLPVTIQFVLLASLETVIPPEIERFEVRGSDGTCGAVRNGLRIRSYKGEELLGICYRTEANLSLREPLVEPLPFPSTSKLSTRALQPI